MSDTAEATSSVRTCKICESPFGEDDDKRFKDCAACRGAVKEEPEAPRVETPPEAPKVTEATADGVEVMSLTVDQVTAPDAPPREFYWCGATKDSPIHNITLGGISFPKFIGQLRDEEGTGEHKFTDNIFDGQIHNLTEAHVALILEHAKGKIVRNYRTEILGDDPNAKQTTVYLGDVLSTSGQRHRPYVFQQGDKPIGNFVYMVKVRSRADRPFDADNPPPPLVERLW